MSNSCFLRMPKFSEAKSLVLLYLEIFGRSELGNNEECILRSIATARPPKDTFEFQKPKTNERRFRVSEPQNHPNAFPNFGTPNPPKDVSEFRNPQTTQTRFRISEPQNHPKTFPNFGTPKLPKDVSEFRNPKTHQRRFRIWEPQNYSKTFPNFGTQELSTDVSVFWNPKTHERRFGSEFRIPKTTKRRFRISEPENYPKTFPNFGTPKPTKDVSEFRNSQTTKRHFQISEPPNSNSEMKISGQKLSIREFYISIQRPRILNATLLLYMSTEGFNIFLST